MLLHSLDSHDWLQVLSKSHDQAVESFNSAVIERSVSAFEKMNPDYSFILCPAHMYAGDDSTYHHS